MGFFLQEAPPQPKGRKAASKASADGQPRARKGPAKAIVIREEGRGSRVGCAHCPLAAQGPALAHPRMLPTGSADPLIYVIGEAPGKNEDEQGRQFIGRSGDYLRRFIPEELLPTIRWNNTVRCRPPENRAPTLNELIACSQYQVEDIEASAPLVILGFGNAPLSWAIDESGISDWRGLMVPVRIGRHACWYAPLWHPSYVMRARNDDKRLGASIEETYRHDLARVFELVTSGSLKPPYIPEEEELHSGLEFDLDWDLQRVKEGLARVDEGVQAVDIETTSLRPYEKDARILSIAFGTWDRSYAIPIKHREAKWSEEQLRVVWKLVGQHLRKPGRLFIAHHLKFEAEWLSMPFALGREILFEVSRWGDTMAQAEVLHMQSLHGKSLNSRCMAMFGIAEKSLDSLDRAHLDLEPLDKVLRYNARDSKFTHLLHSLQGQQIEARELQQAYSLMVSRVPTLTLSQQAGVVPNCEYAKTLHEHHLAEMEGIEKKIQRLPEVKKWCSVEGREFNSDSVQQLASLLRDHMKVKEGWRMVGKVRKFSTDEEVLSRIRHPLARLILKKRELRKMDGTYVLGCCPPDSFKEKGCGKLLYPDGLIHTNYNYLITRTGRLSSSDPNLQNYPIRDGHAYIRNVIMALVGHLMVAIDYGQIEARVIAMASGCRVLHQALWEHYDIHLDWASRLAKRFPEVYEKDYCAEADKTDEAKLLKTFRSYVKNTWTFPLFFGSQLGPVADSLKLIARDLKPLYDEFWDTFKAVRKWQERTLHQYHERGYVETLTGRRRYEPLHDNEIINTPIQGTASDIVLNAEERLAWEAYRSKRWHLVPRMNIHDDLTFYLPEDSLTQDLETIIPIMCQPQFDFVDVPITIEVKIGKMWGEMEEVFSIESTEFGYPQKRKAHHALEHPKKIAGSGRGAAGLIPIR